MPTPTAASSVKLAPSTPLTDSEADLQVGQWLSDPDRQSSKSPLVNAPLTTPQTSALDEHIDGVSRLSDLICGVFVVVMLAAAAWCFFQANGGLA
jgi:hypothetical protein